MGWHTHSWQKPSQWGGAHRIAKHWCLTDLGGILRGNYDAFSLTLVNNLLILVPAASDFINISPNTLSDITYTSPSNTLAQNKRVWCDRLESEFVPRGINNECPHPGASVAAISHFWEHARRCGWARDSCFLFSLSFFSQNFLLKNDETVLREHLRTNVSFSQMQSITCVIHFAWYRQST